MAKLNVYNGLLTRFGHLVDFLTIYTAEAHPLDEWALLNHATFSRLQHRTLDDRISSAMVLKSEGLLGNVVVDSMDNLAAEMYSSQPERIFVIVDRVIRYKSTMGPFGYKPEEVEKWLELHYKEAI